MLGSSGNSRRSRAAICSGEKPSPTAARPRPTAADASRVSSPSAAAPSSARDARPPALDSDAAAHRAISRTTVERCRHNTRAICASLSPTAMPTGSARAPQTRADGATAPRADASPPPHRATDTSTATEHRTPPRRPSPPRRPETAQRSPTAQSATTTDTSTQPLRSTRHRNPSCCVDRITHREREFVAQIHLAGAIWREMPPEDAPGPRRRIEADGGSNRGAGTRQGPPDSPTQTNRNSMSTSSA